MSQAYFVSSSDFRGIANRELPGKADRLFRASVTAFCSLTRPTRREIAQLDDLAMPLYPEVALDTLRYAAAALSECRRGPPALIRRLASERIEIAAPLLIRSQVLGEVDLIAIIGQSGLAHARAIGRRAGLDPRIADLVRILEATATRQASPAAAETPTAEETSAMALPVRANDDGYGDAAEAVRDSLRSMMAAGGQASASPATRAAIRLSGDRSSYEKLRSTALSGAPGLFQTALADALDIGFAEARKLCDRASLPRLMLVLRGLELSAEQAFMLAAAACPDAFVHADSIRAFVDRYELTHWEAGRDEIRALRGETLASIAAAPRAKPADERQPAALLRAS